MAVTDFVLVQGLLDTRGALARWNHDPGPVLRRWFAGAVAVAVVLLCAVWFVSSTVIADPTGLSLPGLTSPAGPLDVLHVLFRNSLVLALHAMACVAGFIAGSSLPLSAAKRRGLNRRIHELARPIAIGWVIAVTCFSLVTQAYIIGSNGATLAAQLHISTGVLMLTVLPHALLELTALFLPLAAWTIASRRDEWNDLLAATFATVAMAIPMLVVAATWEVYAWPTLLRAVAPS